MSKIRKFADFLRDAGEIIVGLPISLSVGGGVVKLIGGSVANPKVSGAIIKSGDMLLKGGVKLSKLYAQGAKIGMRALGKSAIAAKPAITAVAKSLPGSKYVPGIMKFSKVAVPLYLTSAFALKAAKEAQRVKKLTGSAINRLGSERPQFSFQSVLNTFKDALMFR